MAVSREFLKKQFRRLETNYGADRFKINQEMFNLWMELLSDCEEAGIKASVDEYILENEYPPTVASIMKIYRTKEQLRKDILEYILGNYKYISHWYDEKPNEETYIAFKNHICNYPLSVMRVITDELVEKLKDIYNTAENPEQTLTLIGVLKELK